MTGVAPSLPRVVVVGGGLAGLVVAHRLAGGGSSPAIADVVVLESSGRVGGKLRTSRVDAFVVEEGADGFVPGRGELETLASDLHIGGQLMPPRPVKVRAYLRDGVRFDPLLAEGTSPIARPSSLLFSSRLSWIARARLALEPLVGKRSAAGDESLATFLSRRLGRWAYSEGLEPLLAGVYGADPADLSAAATLPHMVAAEADGRSLLSLGRRSRGRTSAAPLLSFRDGMSSLPTAIASVLGSEGIRTDTEVLEVKRTGSAWEVVTATGASETADAVVLALPASTAVPLVGCLPEVVDALSSFRTSATAVVNLGFRGSALGRTLDAHGYLNRRQDQRPVSAVTWSSAKFVGRAPEGHVLLRGFVRGGSVPADGPDQGDQLIGLVRQELRDSLGIQEAPLWHLVRVWSVPVYTVGHPDRVATLRRALAQTPGLSVVGASYDGVGLEAVVRSGNRAADEVARLIDSGERG
jgi:oxygen-dependent protoporphyrinogen oxidase